MPATNVGNVPHAHVTGAAALIEVRVMEPSQATPVGTVGNVHVEYCRVIAVPVTTQKLALDCKLGQVLGTVMASARGKRVNSFFALVQNALAHNVFDHNFFWGGTYLDCVPVEEVTLTVPLIMAATTSEAVVELVGATEGTRLDVQLNKEVSAHKVKINEKYLKIRIGLVLKTFRAQVKLKVWDRTWQTQVASYG